MPGFEPNRFVNNPGIDLEDLTCGICKGIYVKPLVADCCQQTYCSDCIKQWLKTSNTCPNDRSHLTEEKLRPTARALVNLLANLKLTCDYENEGCQSIVKSGDLAKHIRECEYRPDTICKDCLTIREKVSTHNCIKSVLDEKNKMETKINCLADNLEESYNFLRTGLEKYHNYYEEITNKLNQEFQTQMNTINMEIKFISSNFENRMINLESEHSKNMEMLQNGFKLRYNHFKVLNSEGTNKHKILTKKPLLGLKSPSIFFSNQSNISEPSTGFQSPHSDRDNELLITPLASHRNFTTWWTNLAERQQNTNESEVVQQSLPF